MTLKPRKQHKHYPYLFLLNEKTFLRYLRSPPLEYAYHYPLLRLRLYGYRRRELEQSMINLAQEIKTASKILTS